MKTTVAGFFSALIVFAGITLFGVAICYIFGFSYDRVLMIIYGYCTLAYMISRGTI